MMAASGNKSKMPHKNASTRLGVTVQRIKILMNFGTGDRTRGSLAVVLDSNRQINLYLV